MTDISSLLAETKTVLLVDWPSRDVPDTLARHGFTVVSHDGPGADEFNTYALEGREVRVTHVGRRPERAELVYTHRPVEELPEIVETAKSVGAKAVWVQSGSSEARRIVEQAGLTYIDEPYIADAVRAGG